MRLQTWNNNKLKHIVVLANRFYIIYILYSTAQTKAAVSVYNDAQTNFAKL